MAKQSPSTAEVRKNAFWIYGVIVGLVIQDAFARSVTSVLTLGQDDDLQWESVPQLVRLLVVVFLCVRFYLGAVKHFSENYRDTGADEAEEQREYLFDFLIGLFHFVLFYVLAATIDFRVTPGWIFPATLALILLYDVGWLALTRRFESTNRRVRYWAVLNIATVFFTLIVYYIAWRALPQSHALSREAIAYSVVLTISLIDIAELVKGEGVIFKRVSKWLDGLQALIKRLNPWD